MKRHPRKVITLLGIFALLLVTAAATMAAPVPVKITHTITPPPSLTPENQPLKPLVMLTIYDPWRMVIGSDEPSFVLYDNGLVIYQRLGPADAPEFASVQLTPAEVKSLLADLKVNADLYKLEANEDYYTKTDQPTNVIRLDLPQLGEKIISIYGNLWNDEEARQQAAPKPLIDLFDELSTYQHPYAQLWQPSEFEVFIWPYDTSDAVDWPADWPGLNDPATVKRDSGYSLYIDMTDYDRFIELSHQANAVRIDGQTWAFSVRFPFPHEHLAR